MSYTNIQYDVAKVTWENVEKILLMTRRNSEFAVLF